MGITVKGPGGVEVAFPDGTDAETIRSVMARASGTETASTPSKPLLGTDPLDVPASLARGINQVVAQVVTAPYGLLDWAGEKVFGGDFLPDRSSDRMWGPVLNPAQQPSSRAGEYAQQVGQVLGGSVVPTGAALAVASRAAGPAATTTIGQIGQQIVQRARTNPAGFVATDAASAVTGGIAQQAASDAGFGPAGQAVAGIVGGMAPGVVAAYRQPSGDPIGTPTGQAIARDRATQAAQDAAAFEAQGVRPFGPAFNQGPVASVGKQLTETPIVGGPLRNNMDETYREAADATRRLADQIGPTALPETAGQNVQRGLERYARDGMTTIAPERLEAIGVNPNAPARPRQVMSEPQRERLDVAENYRAQERAELMEGAAWRGLTPEDAAAEANRLVPPLAQGRDQLRQARRSIADLSDDELRAVRTTPSRDTSFAVRREAEYEHAWRMLPDMQRINGTRQPQMVATANLQNAVRDLDGQIASQISGQTRIDGDIADRIRAGATQGQFTLADLRAIRTEIGRAMDDWNPTKPSLSQRQLRQLYAAASRDLEVGVTDLANTAFRRYREIPPSDPRHVPREVAAQAARALRAFQMADRLNVAGMERIERFSRILRTENPQDAAQRLVAAASDQRGGNMQMFRSAMGALAPAERADFGALVVRQLGQPTPGARGLVQEVGWSPTTFATRYRAMSQEARDLVFTPEHQRALEQLFRIADRLSNVDALANTSRSGTNAINLTAGAGAVGALSSGDTLTPLAIGAGGLAASVLMSRPSYTQWMVRYTALRSAVREGRDEALAPLLRHISGLERDAQRNPELWPVFVAISQEHGVEPKQDRKQQTSTPPQAPPGQMRAGLSDVPPMFDEPQGSVEIDPTAPATVSDTEDGLPPATSAPAHWSRAQRRDDGGRFARGKPAERRQSPASAPGRSSSTMDLYMRAAAAPAR